LTDFGDLSRKEFENLFCGRSNSASAGGRPEVARELTDDRVENLSLEHAARDREFAEFESNRRIMRILDVETVEAENSLCECEGVSFNLLASNGSTLDRSLPSSSAVP
jgi:hypothetical protein